MSRTHRNFCAKIINNFAHTLFVLRKHFSQCSRKCSEFFIHASHISHHNSCSFSCEKIEVPAHSLFAISFNLQTRLPELPFLRPLSILHSQFPVLFRSQFTNQFFRTHLFRTPRTIPFLRFPFCSPFPVPSQFCSDPSLQTNSSEHTSSELPEPFLFCDSLSVPLSQFRVSSVPIPVYKPILQNISLQNSQNNSLLRFHFYFLFPVPFRVYKQSLQNYISRTPSPFCAPYPFSIPSSESVPIQVSSTTSTFCAFSPCSHHTTSSPLSSHAISCTLPSSLPSTLSLLNSVFPLH